MIGSVLSLKYEILQEITSTEVFSIYRAKDRSNNREVTVRVVNQEVAKDHEFISALQSVVRQDSASIVPGVERVYEMDDDNGEWYIVSEDCPGSTLDERIKRLASFSVPVALETAIEVCQALESLHNDGIVHGDVSARNIVSSQSEGAKVLMPGLWRAYAHSARAAVAMLKNMAPYLAPEVTAGEMPTGQSDIYAVGVLIYRLLTGRFPYPGDSPVAIATKHATAPYPSLRAVQTSVPVALDEIVRKALSKNPKERYRDVKSLLSDLRTLQDALRFGRSLTWPLQPASESEAANPVAPEMNATESPVQEPKSLKRKKKVESDGVPSWLAAVGYITSVLMIIAIGGWFYFNIQRPKPIAVPNLIGKSTVEATNDLKKLGLKLRIGRREASDKFGEGIILDLAPKPGEDVLEHQYVEATVSAGSQFVAVPDLRGRSLEEARGLLQSMNLEIQETDIKYVRDRDLEEGLIVSQIPENGKKIERFSKIKITVSSGKSGETTGGSSGGLHRYLVKLKMPAGTNPVMVRVDLTDDNETQTIHDAEHIPGEEFEVEGYGYGDQVTFRVFFDGEPVKQITQSSKDAAPAE